MEYIFGFLIIVAAYVIWILGYKFITGDYSDPTPEEEDPNIQMNPPVPDELNEKE